MKKKLTAVLFCLLSILFISCGKENNDNGNGEKDILVFAQISEGKTLDPQDTTEQYSQRIINNSSSI